MRLLIGLTTWPIEINPYTVKIILMPLQAVEPQRLYRQIAEQIRAAILAGKFLVGARLPAERDLAQQLGVSRPSVREALIALEVEGWVEVRTGSGIYVLDRSNQAKTAQIDATEWGPLELIRARRVVEGEIASLAALQAKKRDIEAMRVALESMKKDAMQGMFTRLGGHFENLKSWQSAIDEHERILSAIAAHDGPAARAAMHAHMDKSHSRFSASWRRATAP